MSTTCEQLLAVVNETPSDYEERHVRWVSIAYNKSKLIELLYELKYLKEQSEQDIHRIDLLESILVENDLDHLLRLLTNDESANRFALIEKYARIGAIEVILYGKYTVETLSIVSQFPIADYQLTIKRIQELATLITDITNQAANLASGIAGV